MDTRDEMRRRERERVLITPRMGILGVTITPQSGGEREREMER